MEATADARDTPPPSILGNAKVLTSLASGVLLLAGWASSAAGAPPGAWWTLYGASLVVGGYYFGREAIEELLREREVGIELLMSVGALAAAAMGHIGEGAMLAFLYSISEAAEGFTEQKTRAAVKALMKLAPRVALVRRDGVEREVPVEALAVGDLFVVKPGQSIPTDGIIMAGRSSVDQAPVTGESAPVFRGPGEIVFAATINGEGALEVRATRTFAENTLARIIHLVEEAQERKGRSQRFIERFGRVYSPLVLLGGALLAAIPPLALGAGWLTWMARATVFVVAAAPCALVISIPVTMVATLGTGARRGVLIKGGRHVEELARVRVVAFDKTGTLTHGRPELTDVQPLPRLAQIGVSPDEALTIAASVEQHSEHPVAAAILRHAREKGTALGPVTGARALPGAGATALVRGQLVYVGSPELFERMLGVPLDGVQREIERFQDEGKTVVVAGDAGGAWLLLAVRDEIRGQAAEAIRGLRRVGVERLVMLSGDNERAAARVGASLGIDEVRAGLSPEGKVAAVRQLVAMHRHVAMVGDGINDAPALAEAGVGIAMGAAGTDVALETADVALMGDDLTRLGYAIQLARRNRSVVHQNLALSAVVIGVLVVAAVAGALSLPAAVITHEVSEWVVIASGLRMLRA